MLEILLIALIAVAILIFFHNQAIYEFKINQIGWTEKAKMSTLLGERIPLVLKGLPPVAFWTQQDCMMRNCYSEVPVFTDKGLGEWLVGCDPTTACPWSAEHAKLLGALSGLPIWTERELNPTFHPNAAWSLWYRPEVSCWAGSKGLWRLRARWTCLFVTEGAIQVSIVPGTGLQALPPNWRKGDVHPSRLTIYDTPFAADLKFMDIVLRPGHMLIMPNHWLLSWQSLEGSELCPMVCSIEYHTPISRILKG
jgi:hypothetical protein